MTDYESCRLCMRRCCVNRARGELGYCKSSASMHVCRIAPHMWEEPIISGTRGSGTVFFSGCSLGCVYCQNSKISRAELGVSMTPELLSEKLFELATLGVHNINFVTPTHYAPSVVKTVEISKNRGLALPIVYNTGSYDTVQTVKMLNDTVDVYLPDLKYYLPKTAGEYSKAPDYPSAARAAIEEMVKQKGRAIISDGLIKRGVIVRILLLPSHLAEAKLSVKYLYSAYGDDIYISLMNQYTPPENMEKPLDRRVTRAEYRELCDYAATLGIKNAFMQDFGTATSEFIPDFDML